MFAGARGGLEVLRVQEHGRRDQHRVEIRLAQQLLVTAIGARGGSAWNLGLGRIDAVRKEIADGREPRPRIAHHVAAHVPAAPASSIMRTTRRN